MRKVFAIVLSMVLMILSFTTQAEAINSDARTRSTETQAVLTSSSETQEVEDGKFTIEFLQQSSWEELVNTVIPASDDSYSYIENKEDYYVARLVDSICNKRMSWSVYHDAEYISLGFGGMKVEEVDYDRLMQKYQTIIDIYNASNDLQLVWNPKIINEENMQVNVISTNAIEMSHPTSEVGQQVVLKQGTTYWETPQNDGSGKYGIATDDNCYIPEDYVVTVNGFAYYSDGSRDTIMESYYKPYNELGGQGRSIDCAEYRMVHICTETTDLGWVYAEDLVSID